MYLYSLVLQKLAEPVFESLRYLLRQLATKHRYLRVLIGYLWSTYECLVFVYRTHLRSTQAEPATTSPSQLVYVDPEDITRKSDSGCNFLRHAGAIIGGDWDDRDRGDIRETSRYSSFVQRLEKDKEWEDTKFYQYKTRRIESQSQTKDKYRSKNYLDNKCEEIDELYDSIRTHGYQPQEKLLEEKQPDGSSDLVSNYIPLFPDYCVRRHEVAIDIGRDGSMYWNEGRHRITISLILDLDYIPVRVVARHRQWQQIRNTVMNYVEHTVDTDDNYKRLEMVDEYLSSEIDADIKYGSRHPDIKPLVVN